MSRNFFVIFILLFVFLGSSRLFACLSATSRFVAASVEIQVDLDRLNSLCAVNSCLKQGAAVTIRSFSDPRIALNVGENGLTWVAPYKKLVNNEGFGEDGVSFEELKVKELVREDFEALQLLSVINIDEEHRRPILEQIAYGYHFGLCDGVAKAWPVGLECTDGKIQVLPCKVDGTDFLIPEESLK